MASLKRGMSRTARIPYKERQILGEWCCGGRERTLGDLQFEK